MDLACCENIFFYIDSTVDKFIILKAVKSSIKFRLTQKEFQEDYTVVRMGN